MDLSVIIPELNTEKLLRDCLNSLGTSELNKSLSHYSMEVVVSDNGSNDGSLSMAETEFPQIRLVRNGQNLGFAKGNNVALPYTCGRYVLFLNSDTIVLPDSLTRMIKFMDENPRVGLAGFQVQLFTGGLDPDSHRGFPTPWASFCYFSGLERIFPKSKVFGQYHQTWKDLTKTHEIDCTCAAFMVRRQAVEEVSFDKNKWWDEDFFFYGEDLDLCYRLKEKGWLVIYYPEAKIIHYKGGTSGVRKESKDYALRDPQITQKIIESSLAAMKIFYAKHYQNKYPWLLTQLVFLGIRILGVIRPIKKGV